MDKWAQSHEVQKANVTYVSKLGKKLSRKCNICIDN